MNNSFKPHTPAEPNTEAPSNEILQILKQIDHPHVLQKGITATSGGKWAIYLIVTKYISLPIIEIESIGKGYPIVYEVTSGEPTKPLLNIK